MRGPDMIALAWFTYVYQLNQLIKRMVLSKPA